MLSSSSIPFGVKTMSLSLPSRMASRSSLRNCCMASASGTCISSPLFAYRLNMNSTEFWLIVGAILYWRSIDYWMDARGLIGRDNATSGKGEGRFYVIESAEAKRNPRTPRFFESRIGLFGLSCHHSHSGGGVGLFATFTRALANGIRHHAVEPHLRQHQRQCSKRRSHSRRHTRPPIR